MGYMAAGVPKDTWYLLWDAAQRGFVGYCERLGCTENSYNCVGPRIVAGAAKLTD